MFNHEINCTYLVLMTKSSSSLFHWTHPNFVPLNYKKLGHKVFIEVTSEDDYLVIETSYCFKWRVAEICMFCSVWWLKCSSFRDGFICTFVSLLTLKNKLFKLMSCFKVLLKLFSGNILHIFFPIVQCEMEVI